jgi:hypothetical protein
MRAEMNPDADIWHAAGLLIKRHGADDAALVAAQAGDEMLAKGDQEGHAIWKAILDAILDLRRERKEGERVN